MRRSLISAGVAGLALALAAPVALADTNFVNTDLFPSPAGDVTNNADPAGDWDLEGPGIGDGNSNRLGGAANPQVGTDGDFAGVPVFSMGNGTNGHWIDYSYKNALPDVSGLSGSGTATWNATFRARNVNNGTGRGAPVISMTLGNNQDSNTEGVGVSINVVNFPDDTYHYVLTKFDVNSTTVPLLDLGRFDVDGDGDHRDPAYQNAILTMTLNGTSTAVSLIWNGVPVYNNPNEIALGPVDARAQLGFGTAVQPTAGNARGVVWFQGATLTAAVPEPASLGVLGGLGLLALRRRRA